MTALLAKHLQPRDTVIWKDGQIGSVLEKTDKYILIRWSDEVESRFYFDWDEKLFQFVEPDPSVERRLRAIING